MNLSDNEGFLGSDKLLRFNKLIDKVEQSEFNCGYGLDKVLIVEVEFEEFMKEIFVLLLFFEHDEILIGQVSGAVNLKNSQSSYLLIK